MTEIVEWCNAKHHALGIFITSNVSQVTLYNCTLSNGIVFHCTLPKGHTGSHEEHHKDYRVVWE